MKKEIVLTYANNKSDFIDSNSEELKDNLKWLISNYRENDIYNILNIRLDRSHIYVKDIMRYIKDNTPIGIVVITFNDEIIKLSCEKQEKYAVFKPNVYLDMLNKGKAISVNLSSVFKDIEPLKIYRLTGGRIVTDDNLLEILSSLSNKTPQYLFNNSDVIDNMTMALLDAYGRKPCITITGDTLERAKYDKVYNINFNERFIAEIRLGWGALGYNVNAFKLIESITTKRKYKR